MTLQPQQTPHCLVVQFIGIGVGIFPVEKIENHAPFLKQIILYVVYAIFLPTGDTPSTENICLYNEFLTM